mgnify:CR=1 FL=1
MIPKIIHQIWYQDNSTNNFNINYVSIPSQFKNTVKKLININPEYKYYFWNNINIKLFIKKYYPEFYKLFLDCKFMIQRIDLAKYLIIYHYGGFYIDMDCEPIKNLNQFLNKFKNHKLLYVSRTPKFNNLENYVIKLMYNFKTDNYFINNGIIISPKKHDFLKYLLKNIPKYMYNNKDYFYNSIVFNTFGPSSFTNLIIKYKKGIYILENKYFEPCYGKDIKCSVDKETILFHQHRSLWIKNKDYSNFLINFIINNFFNIISKVVTINYFTFLRGYTPLYIILIILIYKKNNHSNL